MMSAIVMGSFGPDRLFAAAQQARNGGKSDGWRTGRCCRADPLRSHPPAAVLHSPGMIAGFPWSVGPGRSDGWPAKARQMSSRLSSEQKKTSGILPERADRRQTAVRPVEPHKVG